MLHERLRADDRYFPDEDFNSLFDKYFVAHTEEAEAQHIDSDKISTSTGPALNPGRALSNRDIRRRARKRQQRKEKRRLAAIRREQEEKTRQSATESTSEM